MGNSVETTVNIGQDELTFNTSETDFNDYINSQMPNNKVAPSYNFLSRTVVDKDKDLFKKLLLVDNTPKGTLVMQIAGVLAQAHGSDIEISIKK